MKLLYSVFVFVFIVDRDVKLLTQLFNTMSLILLLLWDVSSKMHVINNPVCVQSFNSSFASGSSEYFVNS